MSSDTELGCLQILIHPPFRPKITFFVFNEKQISKKIPMGDQNMAPVFASVMSFVQADCKEEHYRIGIPETGM